MTDLEVCSNKQLLLIENPNVDAKIMNDTITA